MTNRVTCQKKLAGFGEWEDGHTDLEQSSGGLVRMTTRHVDPLKDHEPFVTLYTAEEAGRLGLALLAAAREGGWPP